MPTRFITKGGVVINSRRGDENAIGENVDDAPLVPAVAVVVGSVASVAGGNPAAAYTKKNNYFVYNV